MQHLSDNVLHLIGQFTYDSTSVTHYHTSPIYYYFSTLALQNKTMFHRAYDEYFWKNQPFPIVLRNKLIFEEEDDTNEEEDEEEDDAKTNTLLQLEALMNICKFSHLRIMSYWYTRFTSELLSKVSVSLPNVLKRLELNCTSMKCGVLVRCLENLQALESVVLNLKTVTNHKRKPLLLSRKHWKHFEIEYRSPDTHAPMEQFILCCLTSNPDLVSLSLRRVPVPTEIVNVIKSLTKLEKLELTDQRILPSKAAALNEIFSNGANLKVLGITVTSGTYIMPSISEQLSNVEELTYGAQYADWQQTKIHNLPKLRKATLISVPLPKVLEILSPQVTHLNLKHQHGENVSECMKKIADYCPNLVSLISDSEDSYDEAQLSINDMQYILTQLTQLRQLSIRNSKLKQLLSCVAKYAPPTLSDLTIGRSRCTDQTTTFNNCIPLPTIRILRYHMLYSWTPVMLELFPNIVKLELSSADSVLPALLSVKNNIRELVTSVGAYSIRSTKLTGTLPKLQVIEFRYSYYNSDGFRCMLDLAVFLMVAVPNLYECNLLCYMAKQKDNVSAIIEETVEAFRDEHEEEHHSYETFFKFFMNKTISFLQGEYDTSCITQVVDQLTSQQYIDNGDVNSVTLLLPGIYRLLEPIYHEACRVLDTDFGLFAE